MDLLRPSLLLSASVHVAVLAVGGAAAVLGAGGGEEPGTTMPDDLLLMAHYVALAEPAVEHLPAESPGPSQGELNHCDSLAGSTMGVAVARPKGAYGIAGPPNNPDPKMPKKSGPAALARHDAAGTADSPAERAPSFPWAAEQASGQNERSAWGAQYAPEIRDGLGNQGQGVSGKCSHCGAGGLIAMRGAEDEPTSDCTPTRQRVGARYLMTPYSVRACP